MWVAIAFLLINGTLGQARVIPSGSMQNTLLIGDHLIMSRIGYDAGIPFTNLHVSLWRDPQREQVIIFRPPFNPDSPDLVKRVIGMPVVIYMSVDAPESAWEPGQIRGRVLAYARALIHPRLVRWGRLFKTF